MSNSLRYLKQKFPEMAAVQVSGEKTEDLVNRDGIRRCTATAFLRDFP